MSNEKKTLSPEKQQDLALAFEEGEYQHQRAQDEYAFALMALHNATKEGDKDRIAECKADVEAARQKKNRLRYAPAKPQS